MVKMGFNKQKITPPVPVRMGGFEGVRIARQVHDDLYTRCLVFEDEGVVYLLAQCDLVAIDHLLLEGVWERVRDLGIDKDHIILTAIHTHSGPGGVVNTVQEHFSQLQDIFGELDEDLLYNIADRISVGAHLAAEDMQEVVLTVARGSVENVGTERHDARLPGDNSLLVLLMERKEDHKRVLVYNYSCHPTVMNPKNLKISADLPYPIVRDSPFDMTVFINGCCGNISTRFTRKDSSFEQIEVYAREIKKGISRALRKPLYQGELDRINMNRYSLDLKAKKAGSVAQKKRYLEKKEKQLAEAREKGVKDAKLRLLETDVEGAKVALSMAEALQGVENINFSFTILRLADLSIVVIPGELYSTLGGQLRDEGIDVFCYGNGYYLYIADREAYEKLHYEAMSSPFEKGTGETLVEEIVKANKEFKKGLN